MPLGARKDEVGLILHDRGCLVLVRDDGGTWQLDGPGVLGAYAGRRAAVGGVRSGFDRIEVDSVDGHALARRPCIASWEVSLSVLSILGTLAALLAAIG